MLCNVIWGKIIRIKKLSCPNLFTVHCKYAPLTLALTVCYTTAVNLLTEEQMFSLAFVQPCKLYFLQ